MGILFGTDGVRGKANVELTPELAFKLGRAGAFVLAKENEKTPIIVIGMDTRISCDMLESALIAGITSVGAKVVCAGIIPTPAIAYLVRKNGYDAGVMISASHNPFYDNGIKFFNNEGYKLKDEIEAEIEDYILNNMDKIASAVDEQIGTRNVLETATLDYIDFLKSTIDGMSLSGLKIALDCGNGATYKTARQVFEQLGAIVSVINDTPNGLNINDDCGSTHVEGLCAHIKSGNFDVGFAFDGDGDRLITVDSAGDIIDGDQLLSIIGNVLKKQNKLNKNTIVATVMSNLGFLQMGAKNGINIVAANVGDRYVLEEMLKGGYNLGGEQSGHIIFLDYNTTGDGILSAIQLCKLLIQTGKTVAMLNCEMVLLPQILHNVKVDNSVKYAFQTDPLILAEIAIIDKLLEGRGRLLMRPSGTEPLIRIMIEGEDIDEITALAHRLAGML